MKATAKYLPIKGDIRKEDVVTDLVIKGKVVKIKGDACEIENIDNQIVTKEKKENLVRLGFFAVTFENIKMNDAVVIATPRQTFLKQVKAIADTGYYLTDDKTEEEQFYELKYVFKVLGEIPQQCIWIKEDEEIEIEQNKHTIRIKCPCCETLI